MKSKKKSFSLGKMSVQKKMEHGGYHPPTNPPTEADSLFLLRNNRLINQLKRDFGYSVDPTSSTLPVSSWMSPAAHDLTGFENAKTKSIRGLDSDLADKPTRATSGRTKDRSQYVDFSKKGFFGLTDYLIGGGEDYFMPKSYIHPGIKPTSSGDFVTEAKFSDFSFDELKKVFPNLTYEDYTSGVGRERLPNVATFLYDDLAITPTRYLTPEQRQERIRLYGPENVGDINAPTDPMPSTSKPPSRPRIQIDKMPPLDFSIDLPTTLQPIERSEGDRLIDTQDIYRTPLSNRNNVRGDEQFLDQVGERRVYERPDGTRYTSVDRFSPEMIRQLRRLQRERERGTVTF